MSRANYVSTHFGYLESETRINKMTLQDITFTQEGSPTLISNFINILDHSVCLKDFCNVVTRCKRK